MNIIGICELALRSVKVRFLKIRWRMRRFLLNKRAGVYVANSAVISASALLQTEATGIGGGHIHVSEGVTISEGVILATSGGRIDIEENVFIGPYCVLYGHGGLRIGKDTLIAAHTVIIPNSHGFLDLRVPIREQIETSVGINIEENVWIGCGVRILDGVTIGKGCVVGAGAVVNKSLNSNLVVVGVPARALRKRA